ncbi:MAG: hypothetical protein C0521_01075 [Xanthomonas sp.]|nr:hypothetical protein [Xanthomonas sp.]
MARMQSASLVLSAAILALSVPLAHSQETSDRGAHESRQVPTSTTTATPRPFEELDQNADGAISKDEAAVDPPLAQVFGTLDKDADGRLSPDEYAAYAPGTP